MDIKTRESLQTVKTFDRLQNLGARTRKGFDEAKENVQEVTSATGESENEYAGSKLQNAEHGVIRSAVYGADKVGRWVSSKRQEISEIGGKVYCKNRERHSQDRKGRGENLCQNCENHCQECKGNRQSICKGGTSGAVQATIKSVKVAVKAIVAATKAVIAAVKGIIAAIAAGGWVAVVVILILCIIGGVVAWVSSIFGSGDDGGYSTGYMMSVCQNEYKAKENSLIEQTPHDYLVTEGNEPNAREVIAVFAVLTDLDVRDLQSVDEKQQSEFRTVFEKMNRLESYCTTSEETVMRQHTDKDGKTYEKAETVTKTTLHIVRHTMGATETGEYFKFDKRQMELLQTLLSDELDGIWLTEQTDP